MEVVYLAIPLAPLLGALIAGLFGKQIGRSAAHWVTTGSVALSFLLSLLVFKHITLDGAGVYNQAVYTWAVVDGIDMSIGFLIDNLTILMMLVVTFVSLMVHVYTIGYMHDDPGYQRFFSYISLFTFSMLMLVMSNNFLQLFFGWEAVGLVSYLLIGFWYEKDSAISANMKAFIVNRIGDFGFLLGIAIILIYTNSMEYTAAFEKFESHKLGVLNNMPVSVGPLSTLDNIDALDLALILLFVGAMGKSAQVPLHVWLPDSMEGPTPISALIHAATMVTAGIFMVARMSPLYELSDLALNVILVVGATTAFFMGLVGIVQNDIKRVIAYSTLSQLGYMTVALGASAYSAAIFHLMTHAFFKALLFLAAGSVIIAMHHEQDIRKMGGLRRYMPITYWTALIGSLALIGFPGLSGFFSKDLIIEAVSESGLMMSGYAYIMVLLGVFVTAFYSFRMFFLVFHGDERMDDETLSHLKEPPKVITLPLILLAIPSVLAGYFIGSVALGDFFNQVIMPNTEGLRDITTIMMDESHHLAIPELRENYHGVLGFILHGFVSPVLWLAAAGVGLAWYIYMKNDELADWFYDNFRWLHQLLEEKYYLDRFNQQVFANGATYLGNSLWTLGDRLLIDGLLVNGSAKLVGLVSGLVRRMQSGYLYHYAFSMVLGLALMVAWVLFAFSS